MVGVACAHSQAVIMEKLNTGKKTNGKKIVKLVKVMKKVKKVKGKKNAASASASVVVSKEEVSVVAEKNDGVSISVNNNNDDNNDEIEEGELGTLPIENGELVLPGRRFEIKSEIEKGEFVPGRWRRNADDFDRNVSKDEVEKGEFVPERLYGQNQYGYSKNNNRRYDGSKEKGWKYDRGGWKFDRDSEWNQNYGKEKGWKGDHDWKFERERGEREWTPPLSTGKYSNEKGWKGEHEWSPPSGKDKGWKYDREREQREWTPPSSGGKSGGGSQQSRKFNARYDVEKKQSKNSFRGSGDEGFVKSDLSNGKNQNHAAKDDYFGNRLKRHGNDFENNERKYRDDYDEYAGAKNRKLPDDGNHYSGRPYKKVAGSSSRNIPSERYSSRYPDSSRPVNVNDGRVSSPHQSERSPNDRFRHYDRARSPSQRDRSPYERPHMQDRRDRSPYKRAYQQDRSRSPYDRKGRYDSGRNRDDRDRTPPYLEKSPLDRGKYNKQWEMDRKAVAGEKRLSDQRSKEQEGRYSKKDEESQRLAKESENKEILDNGNHASEKVASSPRHHEEMECSSLNNLESSLENGATEELASMEEDMDICNTPPHVPAMVDHAVAGKWYYLDQFGEERGPTKLSDLKTLVEEGHLASDHFIKHLDFNRWITVENAVSPLRPANFPSVVPDSVTQLACPPEASGNLLEDSGKGAIGNLDGEEMLAPSLAVHESERGLAASEAVKDLNIDERVGTFSKGVTLIPGREHEMIAEMLEMTIEQGSWERWQNVEGYIWHQQHMVELSDDKVAADLSIVSEHEPKDHTESDKDNEFCYSGTSDLFSGRWALKGGDWKINDEASQDRNWKRKQVLNDGYPLCQMPKSTCEDPRWQRKHELYYPSQSRRLDLPLWAFSSLDELIDPKSMVPKGIKGTMLPVIRINACVVNDHGSFISEPRAKARGKERFLTKSLRPYSTAGDSKRSSEDSHSKSSHELDSNDSWKKTELVTTPKDRLCKADELQLHLGDWYYLDGAGHEQGPSSFSELLRMADQGVIQKHSSIFRKPDKVWIPLNSLPEPSRSTEIETSISGGFHDLHPQFIGFTRGKLHELVMKSYKSREFAAAINEVLDPWINTRQPNDHLRVSKRARTDEAEEEYAMEEDESTLKNDECSFDDLCSDITFCKGDELVYKVESNNWDLLDGRVLARIFHFLRADLKSLVYAALTCKHWRSAVKSYKDVSTQVDFCGIAPNGPDSTALKIMNDYNRGKIKSLILRGCTGVTSVLLEELLRSFTCLSSIDIRGCPQLEDLIVKFPHISWIKNSRPKLRIHNPSQLNEKGLSASNQMEYSSGLKEYLENSDKAKFRHSLYKRSKLFDARKSSSISSRDAQLRRLAMKKYGNGYKRMEEFIAISLEEIMKGNTFPFFETKVADIEERMKSGYYASRGLTAVKEDISCMCRDAIKTKNRGDTKDLNRIVKLFIQLATSLEKGSKLAYGKDEIMQSWKDNVPPGFSSSSSRYKKNPNKSSERKQTYRSNGSSFVNGFIDSTEVASDREIRRRLSKLNKKSLDSESDTSDDFDKSSFGSVTNSETTASDTESDLEFHSEGSKREVCFTPDYGFDLLADEREWGARMTKASLVPPVTRKYEVIDHYVIVADEDEVKRKMQVSLPEDYNEKLNAQRIGTDESDMEIPEVKDFKPRKTVGDEVIEQEVYGIDPYTHNLLLDSMPDESDWSLVEKHLFIEDVLLRSLNKKVRNFTGSGNTPMVYPLKPVFQEILENAKEKFDKKTVRLCQFILKAIDSRPEDNYVAYRKGLGVVCNKEGGFSEDDFVVEFLGEVYPTWKWYEKQDGIRALQKNKDEQAPEFYNIYLERPKGDADGYDLVVVDAMHKANYASRICHSCKPNCEAKVTAVDGQYQIGIYSLRPIAYGEEVTFDYNSVTESKEEYEASVCLCGNQVCRGSYLNLTGEGAYQKVLKEYHGLLDRHRLLLEACELNLVSEEDYIELGKAGLGSCMLGGLPDWLIAYSARLVRFINFERTKLPAVILKHNIEEKKKYFAEVHLDVEKSDAEIQAEGVYNQRLQNLALTIDKVKYVMRCVFGDPKKAPPPLERLSPEEAVSYIWKGEGSFVEDLIQCMGPHIEDVMLRDLKAKIHAHDPSVSDDMESGLRKSLLWLRDEVRNLPCTYKSRHDAAADLIHVHAYTKSFIRIREYKSVTSPPVYITPLDLGPKYADKLGPGVHEYCKTYGEMYCLGQLMFWHSQNAEPDAMLDKASRGCLSLPDIGSFYAKFQKPARQRVYGPKTVKFMISRMEKQPQKPWPKDRIWSFKTSIRIVGCPMLDTVLHGDTSSMDKEMLHWLKHRRSVFQAPWDR